MCKRNKQSNQFVNLFFIVRQRNLLFPLLYVFNILISHYLIKNWMNYFLRNEKAIKHDIYFLDLVYFILNLVYKGVT
jgi:hypothetical protein